MEQWNVQARVESGENWRLRGRAVMQILNAELSEQGITPREAPPLPPIQVCDGFISEPYRVLCVWIPDWLSHPDAGYYVVRVDTLTNTK